jgi:ammonium transporter, Amt family
MTKLQRALPLAAMAALLPFPAFAAADSGDTSWMLASAALVLLMTPGLAFFYAGMVRTKNVVSTLYQNMIAVAVIGLVWVIAGFSIAFSGDGAFFGDGKFFMLNGVGQEADGTLGTTIPFMLFMAYQMMFAIITPALMTGAFAERVRFRAWIMILVLWSLAVYSPIAHWVWSPSGYLFKAGALDFAGGFVVHMSAGFSALVAAIMFGRRRDFGAAQRPHDIGMVVLGTGLLWFGWFGFNAGSALAANGLAAQAFVNTFIASAAAMLCWTLFDRMKDGKATCIGGCIGVVAGLVAITPAAGFVTVQSAILIGVAAGFICNIVARFFKNNLKIDDTLDVFACHGIGGTIGVLSVGLLATTAVNPAGAEGLLNGGDKLFGAQIMAAVMVAVYSMVATFLIIKVTGIIVPVRVPDQDEVTGLDVTQHNEKVNSCCN